MLSPTQLQQYLTKLNYKPAIPNTPVTACYTLLDTLTRLHTQRFPWFSDMFDQAADMNPAICATPDWCFNRIVIEEAGGLCATHCILFHAALCSLGFPGCYIMVCRNRSAADKTLSFAHHAVVVVPWAGKKYLCDVGHSYMSAAAPLQATVGIDQTDGLYTYRVVDDYPLPVEQRRTSNKYCTVLRKGQPTMIFPADLPEAEVPCDLEQMYWVAAHPLHHWKRNFVLHRRVGFAQSIIVNQMFSFVQKGKPPTRLRITDGEEFVRLVREEFGVLTPKEAVLQLWESMPKVDSLLLVPRAKI
eukprot:TRINITY_DN68020_c1_g2_i8.p2 TRINITY_DN68020_c1_g2~~TRINITY_DN68020_c1_g2_i8.p2  ORF type:complete len:301 (+),score=35.96 TRINITY_DN68020_c1_g2_i8:46-948(+)